MGRFLGFKNCCVKRYETIRVVELDINGSPDSPKSLTESLKELISMVITKSNSFEKILPSKTAKSRLIFLYSMLRVSLELISRRCCS